MGLQTENPIYFSLEYVTEQFPFKCLRIPIIFFLKFNLYFKYKIFLKYGYYHKFIFQKKKQF